LATNLNCIAREIKKAGALDTRPLEIRGVVDIESFVQTSKLWIQQKFSQIAFGDMVLKYHKKIRSLIALFNCRYLY